MFTGQPFSFGPDKHSNMRRAIAKSRHTGAAILCQLTQAHGVSDTSVPWSCAQEASTCVRMPFLRRSILVVWFTNDTVAVAQSAVIARYRPAYGPPIHSKTFPEFIQWAPKGRAVGVAIDFAVGDKGYKTAVLGTVGVSKAVNP